MRPADVKCVPETAETIERGDCPTYWNSHICDLRARHTVPHTCMPNRLYVDHSEDDDPGNIDCSTRFGFEDDVVHVDPLDSCGDHACTVCFISVPDAMSPRGRRWAGRTREPVEHDTASCPWCAPIERGVCDDDTG